MITDSAIDIDAPPTARVAGLLRRRALAGMDRLGDQPERARRAGSRGGKAVRDQAAPPAQARVGGDRGRRGRRSWTWEQRSPGGRTVAIHEVIPKAGDRTLVRQRLDQHGPIGALRRPAHARHHQALPRARGQRPQGAQRADCVARPPDVERRRQLLDALIDAFADGGIGDRSLREIAEAVGTSHRMLLHHFGSRDELLLAIVEEVERRQMAALPDAVHRARRRLRRHVGRPSPARAAPVRAALLRVLRPRSAGRAAVRPHGARRRRLLARRGRREDRRDRRPRVRAARAGGHPRPAARSGRHRRRRGRRRGRPGVRRAAPCGRQLRPAPPACPRAVRRSRRSGPRRGRAGRTAPR